MKNFIKKTFQNMLGKTTPEAMETIRLDFASTALRRSVVVDIYLPPQYRSDKKANFPLILFNDGQDATALELTKTLENATTPPFVMVGLHCNQDRIYEYGTASQAHYKGYGAKAAAYTTFVTTEILPFLRQNYRLKTAASQNIILGFSLGALSALDIAWKNPTIFGKVGIFSGSLWWRSAPFTDADPDANRIMHDIIQKTAVSEAQRNQKFWFEVGTNDEKDDRNNNGIIDAIDDTLDLIDELAAKGFKPHQDLTYVEIQGGEHNPKTWGKVMPDFLTWAMRD